MKIGKALINDDWQSREPPFYNPNNNRVYVRKGDEFEILLEHHCTVSDDEYVYTIRLLSTGQICLFLKKHIEIIKDSDKEIQINLW